MIKFFQKLKAKKGFTLVELIVVIAIIGVLAAILIPTMLGYVTSSRVTSANSTAAEIKNNIDTFLTDADTAGYGMKQGAGLVSSTDITVTSGGTWAMTAFTSASNNFKTGGSTITWGVGASAVTLSTTKTGVTSAEQLLAITLCNLFPEIKTAAIHVELVGGKCTAVAYTADQGSAIATSDMPGITSGKFDSTFAWDSKTAGVAPGGIIVGTAPAIPMN